MTMGMPDGYRLATGTGAWLEGKSGALIRCRPDGTRPEVVCRGFVNLVEVAFLPGGDVIGTDNWYQEPAGGLRDALVHLVEGGLYPYVPDEGTPQPVTGDPLPAVSRFPAVALSGLARYDGSAFPADYAGNLFSAQHNARAVGRHILSTQGSTYRSEDRPFLTTDDPDFHPSDVLVDADGSLLVIDTGAWYVQHCPTGRIRPSPSRGGIYRVRHRGAAKAVDPWGKALEWKGLGPAPLAARLADPRVAVREKAMRALSALGAPAVKAVASMALHSPLAIARTEAVWTLATIDAADTGPALRRALDDPDQDVACSAARALGRRGDHEASADLAAKLSSGREKPRLAAAAAEALSRAGDRGCLPQVWNAIAAGADPFLEHALALAAHRVADTPDLRAALDRPEPAVQAVALRLLDQPPRPRGVLAEADVMTRAGAADANLRRAAIQVLGRHPEWAGGQPTSCAASCSPPTPTRPDWLRSLTWPWRCTVSRRCRRSWPNWLGM